MKFKRLGWKCKIILVEVCRLTECVHHKCALFSITTWSTFLLGLGRPFLEISFVSLRTRVADSLVSYSEVLVIICLGKFCAVCNYRRDFVDIKLSFFYIFQYRNSVWVMIETSNVIKFGNCKTWKKIIFGVKRNKRYENLRNFHRRTCKSQSQR